MQIMQVTIRPISPPLSRNARIVTLNFESVILAQSVLLMTSLY